MTSPTGKKQQPEQNKMEMAAAFEQALAELHYHNQQLKRTLWLLLKQAGGSATLNEQEIDLLWKLSSERTPEGLLKLAAHQIPEANEDDIAQCAKDLLGTNGLLHVYTEAHERLKNYPPQYIELRLSKHIRFIGDRWETAAPST